MDKHAAALVLDQIASFLELKGDAKNQFRVRAFRNAAHAVEDFEGDFAEAVRSGALGDLKGVGPATLDVMKELVEQGRSSYLETLRGDVPEGLVDMLRIAGLGVARVRVVHDKLGISTVAELEAAAKEGRLARLPRFGKKSAERVLRGIDFLRRTGERYLLHHALRQAERFCRTLSAFPEVSQAVVSGSVRRRLELVRDIDVAVMSDAPAAVADRIAALPTVRDVVGRGDPQFTVHFHSGAPAKIYVGPAANFGHLLARTTGTRAHLDALRAIGAGKGITIDEAGVRKQDQAVPCPDEATLYRLLGLPVIPAELREGMGEVEKALAGKLPALLEREDLKGFLHCHTNYSDGSNTVAQLAAACAAAGYSYLGVTDHSESAYFAGGLKKEELIRQHEEIDAFNRTTSSIRVLKGVEADILADGSIDYGPDFLGRFDFVIASIHSRFEMDEAQMTARMLKALDDPHASIIGHPTGRLLMARDPYAIDIHAVIARAAERGAAMEINADPHRLDLDWRYCIEARDAGVPIPIGADAHSIAGLEYVDLGVGMARKAGLTKDDVLNARDVEGFLRHAQARR